MELEEIFKNGITIELKDKNKTKLHFDNFKVMRKREKLLFTVKLPDWVCGGRYWTFEYGKPFTI